MIIVSFTDNFFGEASDLTLQHFERFPPRVPCFEATPHWHVLSKQRSCPLNTGLHINDIWVIQPFAAHAFIGNRRDSRHEWGAVGIFTAYTRAMDPHFPPHAFTSPQPSNLPSSLRPQSLRLSRCHQNLFRPWPELAPKAKGRPPL